MPVLFLNWGVPAIFFDCCYPEGTRAMEVLSRAFPIEVVVRVHADLAEFAVPFLSPGHSVGDEMFYSIAAYAPVPAVHLPEPVASLTDGGFGDTVDARSKLGVVGPVGGLPPAAPTTVSCVKGAGATCFRGDVPNWGHFALSGSAADWQPFIPLGFWGDKGAEGFRDDGAGVREKYFYDFQFNFLDH